MHTKNKMNTVEYAFKTLRSVGSVGPENMIQWNDRRRIQVIIHRPCKNWHTIF